MNYYIGPWQWKTEDEHSFWAAPATTVGMVDLRPLAACAAQGSHALNFGFFATEKPLDSSYIALGSDLEVLLSLAQRDAWCQTVGIPSLPTHCRALLDVLIETLTVQADPEQGRRVQGLRPGQKGQFEFLLAGRTIWTRPFAGLADPAWPRLKQAIQVDFRKNFEQDSASLLADKEVHRRLLTDWMGKYKISDWREFVPADLFKDVEGPLPRLTHIGDDFTDSDSTSLDAHAATGSGYTIGWYWTEVDGQTIISSNTWVPDTSWNLDHSSRADYDLSSDDHYALGKNAYWRAQPVGACARFASAAATYYTARTGESSGDIAKYVTGTETELWTLGDGEPVDFEIKIEVNGTTIKHYLDGVETHSLTDASISGNVRTGLQVEYSDSPPGDNHFSEFEAEDLAVGGFIPYPFSRGLRGGSHALSGGLS